MASLLLSVVGSVIGGPIGGAIGAALGQVIDREILFKPKGRQGPRLIELAVQTSSYGTPMPKVFGTMRVAGSVIWSTDLIESRSTTRAKGQPGTNNYSYSVSFAVLLSARPVQGVGRIWADGKLLRGTGGDFKTATGFRLHNGGEDQAVDPLIASAEGALAPAHRGCAYAVFENFQLADYGNRIPSLTFEVIADPAPVPIGVIASALADPFVDGSAVAMTLPGFSAYGDSARGVLETLALAAGAWFVPDGARLVMRNASATPTTIADAGMAPIRARGSRRTRSIAPIESVPQSITIGHYDPARDYQLGLQRARRPGAGTRSDRIEMPAVIEAGAAKAIARAILARGEAARERRTVALGWASLEIAPGADVQLADTPGHWRVASWSLEAMVLMLALIRLPEAPGASSAHSGSARSGRALVSPDLVHGPTLLHGFEIPPINHALLAAPQLQVAAAGNQPGWRRAALLVSVDGGGQWRGAGATGLPAVIGTLDAPIQRAPATLRDLHSGIEVTLAHAGMLLADADDRVMDAGGNLALIGDELIQFGRAARIGVTRWRLSRLLRGRQGTESAAGAQSVGDRFVLIDPDSLAVIDLSLTQIGARADVLASGVGDTIGPAATSATISGASVVPPSPVHLALRRESDGSATLTWARRSRVGWRWIDSVTVPLGEEREAYQVRITSGSAGTELIGTVEPRCVLPMAIAVPGAEITVVQLGSNGPSLPDKLSIV